MYRTALTFIFVLIHSVVFSQTHVSLSIHSEQSDLRWDTSFGAGYLESFLHHPGRGEMFELEYETKLNGLGGVLVGFVGQLTAYDQRIGSDEDRLARIMFNQAFFRNRMNRTLFGAKVGYEFYQVRAFLFYQYHSIVNDLTDGRVFVQPGFVFPILKGYNIPDLQSTYDFHSHALGIGGDYSYNVTKSVWAVFHVAYYPFASLGAEGYWNLRRMNFDHTDFSETEIIEGGAYLRVPVSDAFAVRGGFRFFHLRGENGTAFAVENGEVWGLDDVDIRTFGRSFYLTLEMALRTNDE